MPKKLAQKLRAMRLKSLDQLEGVTSGKPPYDSYLARTIHALRRKPIGEFSTEDLRITIGQGEGIPYLVPLALERLEENPFLAGDYYPGDLLLAVLRAEAHWGGDQELRSRVRAVVEEALERLARVEPVNWASGELPTPEAPDEFDRAQLEPALKAALGTLAS